MIGEAPTIISYAAIGITPEEIRKIEIQTRNAIGLHENPGLNPLIWSS
jgi:hypothetical protein